ncbi:glutathione S-transferase family protein [Brevundimonas sp.]|uniref:glutathione S-transferase family protein n=1 Tax=Brevundimonas sp. TaxID=1871086 RepID=UPI002D5D53D2|nr:glutathione S-transferase family protein [Brevundimonas sp.]HYD28504.1 glutathione S-transferase family protein [Brevundimonas sp.]
MLTLFHAPWSRSSRLLWLLEEAGAPYDICYCDIVRGDGSGARDARNPHPDGKVPALLHEDVLVTESAAVALYVTDLFPGAGLGAPVGSPERGAYLTWLAWIAGEMEPAFWAKISGATEGDPALQARYDAVVVRLFGALERGPYLMGQRFTAVDVMAGSALAWARDHVPASAVLDAWLERILDRPANAVATARDGTPPVLSQVA